MHSCNTSTLAMRQEGSQQGLAIKTVSSYHKLELATSANLANNNNNNNNNDNNN